MSKKKKKKKKINRFSANKKQKKIPDTIIQKYERLNLVFM